MRKVFIDTSVFIRFLTRDDQKKFEDCRAMFELIREGKIRPYTSNTVIMEIIFILTRHYTFSKSRVMKAVESLLLLRGLTLIEKTYTQKALALYAKHHIKYGDSLIISQLPSSVVLVTYDNDFTQIPGLNVSDPGKIAKK